MATLNTVPGGPARCLVTVPVKDEADQIAQCLRAIAGQHEVQADGIVVLINNTTDATAQVVREVSAGLEVPVHAIEHFFGPAQACAGAARRMGMEYAASLLGSGGVLLTTDADGMVAPDWIAANLWHLRDGVDAVAGRAVLSPADAALIPPALHWADAEECAYATVLDEIAVLLDPQPWDRPPRHVEHSGASIAVGLAAYRRAGGMPASALAEDRHFFEALRRVDARIRHAPEIVVTVSGRTVGRAEGGMADTIRRRLSVLDPYLDGALEPAFPAARRAWLRHCFGRAFDDASARRTIVPMLADATDLTHAEVMAALGMMFRGEGWAYLEDQSARLRRCQVAVVNLPVEMVAAERLRDALRMATTDETRRDGAVTGLLRTAPLPALEDRLAQS